MYAGNGCAGCAASSNGSGTPDEVYVTINGEMHYLWRAVDQEGEVLESYVTKTSDKAAALSFMKRALKRRGSPEVVTTDGMRSYKAAMEELGSAEKQEIGRWANNRVENSHLPFRRRTERPTRPAGRLHWPRGKASSPEACAHKRQLRLSETSCD